MRRRWVYVDGVPYEYGHEPVQTHHVIPDIEPFMSPDGAYITGRAAWREHLKRTDSIEMGHSDMKAARTLWNKRQEAHRDRIKGAEKLVREAPKGEIKPFERSGLNVEMANRLHGRPIPERKELIKLTLEQAKRMHGRNR